MLWNILKHEGKLLILYMAWLPYEDEIADASEKIVLRYSPDWTGAGERMHPIDIPKIAYKYFTLEHHEEYLLDIPFTRESWHGRMKACRGVGASLSGDQLAQWECDHLQMLDEKMKGKGEVFEVKHYASIAVLKKKSSE